MGRDNKEAQGDDVAEECGTPNLIQGRWNLLLSSPRRSRSSPRKLQFHCLRLNPYHKTRQYDRQSVIPVNEDEDRSFTFIMACPPGEYTGVIAECLGLKKRKAKI